MRYVLLLLAVFALGSRSAEADVYELRVYTTHEGRLDDLHARFRDHTVQLFEKHGMINVGYWVPVDEPRSRNTLIYILRHKSREAAQKSWTAFLNDPEWKKVFAESRRNGPLLAKAPESTFMVATDYSPEWKNDKAEEDDVFELRVYQTAPGKLEKLDARFRDHTIRIFNRHGMKSVGYWHVMDEPKSRDHLIYILKHESREAAKASWKAFSQDPEWRRVAAESGVGRLAKRPESTYMKATDYSPIK